MKLPIRTLILFTLLLLTQISRSAPVLIPSAPQIAAKGYILMDANSGKVIVEHNADEQLEPASLTKMMTAYVAEYELAQGNISLDDITTVSKRAWAKNYPGSSLMFLEAGKQVSVGDLLKGVIISSGNDATVALAEHVAGSTEAFSDLMNQHAQLLGMDATHFVNPHGLPNPGHYTTARDMAKLAQAIIRDFPEEYKIYSEKYYTYNGIKQNNRNLLLWRDPSVDGLKTGHTESAGYCLVSSAKKDDMRLIAVVMGTKTEEARLRESQKLLSFGFRYYKTLKIYSSGEEISEQKVWGGDSENVKLVAGKDVYVTVPRSQKDEIKAELEVEKYLQAPIKAGQNLGDVVLMLEGQEVLHQPVVADRDVEQGGLFKVLWDKLKLFILQLFEN